MAKIEEKNEKIDEATIKREKMLIYILVSYPDESFSKLKDIVSNNLIKVETHKHILKKLYEEYEKGNINNDILDYFDDTEIINYLSGIMAYDFEIKDINKCIDDLISIYTKEILINRRNEIVKNLENTQSMSSGDVQALERELNDIIIKLAKIK